MVRRQWDSTVSDLSVHRPTRHELEARKIALQSPNVEAAKRDVAHKRAQLACAPPPPRPATRKRTRAHHRVRRLSLHAGYSGFAVKTATTAIVPYAVKTPAHLYAGSTRPRTPAKALELLAKGSHGGQERYAMQQLEKVEHELQLLAEDAGSAEADVPVWDLAAELNSAPPPRPEADEGVDLDAEIEQFRGRTSGRWQKRAETSAASADLADPLSEYAAPPTPSFSTRSTFGSTPTGRLDLSSIDALRFSRPPTTPTHNVSSRAVDAVACPSA